MNGGRIEQQGRRAKSSTIPHRLRRNSSAVTMSLPSVTKLCRSRRSPQAEKTRRSRQRSVIAGTISEIDIRDLCPIAIVAEGGADISAQLADNQFDAANYAVGERVLATWTRRRQPLKTSSSVNRPSLKGGLTSRRDH